MVQIRTIIKKILNIKTISKTHLKIYFCFTNYKKQFLKPIFKKYFL